MTSQHGMADETLEQRVQRVLKEEVAIAPYDPRWPEFFRVEKEHLLHVLPKDLIRRIEHSEAPRWPVSLLSLLWTS